MDSYCFTELHRVDDHYDPENDILRCPCNRKYLVRVSHTAKVLIDCVLELQERVQRLEEKNEDN